MAFIGTRRPESFTYIGGGNGEGQPTGVTKIIKGGRWKKQK